MAVLVVIWSVLSGVDEESCIPRRTAVRPALEVIMLAVVAVAAAQRDLYEVFESWGRE